MNPEIEKFISKATQKETKKTQQRRKILLSKLGLKVRDITDEEYNEICKYAHLYNIDMYENNSSENFLKFISVIIFIFSTIAGITLIISGIDSMMSAGIILLGFAIIQLSCVIVFTKISQKISNIERMLNERFKL